MPHRSVAVWNAIVTGCAENGYSDVALDMFRRMHLLGVKHDNYTFAGVLSLCSLELVDFGRQVNEGLRDEITSNAMIGGLVSVGRDKEALIMFVEMQNICLRPIELTFVSVISSCSCARVGHQIHALAIMMGFEMYKSVSNATVTMYSSCGDLNAARMVFERLEGNDIVSWNAMITSYAKGNLGEQQLWPTLKCRGKELNLMSLLLKVCASSESIEIVEMIQSLVIRNGLIFIIEVHDYIIKQGLFSEALLVNALISMYAKSGVLDLCLRVFNSMSIINEIINEDIVSWNSLISACAQHGEGKTAVRCFEAMLDSGKVLPDRATFTSVLLACSHSGLVDDGTRIFNSMVRNYGFQPGVDHLSCVVDLLGRAGYLDEAKRLLNSKHIELDSNTWWTLFSSCAAHGNLRLGRTIAGFLLQKEQNNPAVYVQLSNIYANAEQWEEAANLREMMKSHGVIKQSGYSWVTSSHSKAMNAHGFGIEICLHPTRGVRAL
ncbi:hypothetical protein RHMOL_Rhmol03G0281600 [Rhododendron molle]|uniref:Uncharacterized protein n=1 Tax=Rhododendron molle TaxID=49168 RepID=A0ACC0PKL8_RHOML|nr:hypothetical protein RHMOL_Rhmol03G0281600 [Rhododendron molle]